VVRENDRLLIELEQTLFYPTSGGQSCDLGTLNAVPVLDVVERGETIVHTLVAEESTKKWAKGRELEGAIDMARRHDHMEQHSGQHLLSAILLRQFEIETIGFHLGALSVLDAAADVTRKQISEIEEEVNAKIRACLDIKETIHRGSAVTPVDHFRTKPAPQELDAPHGLRVIQIGPDDEPFDRDPCCGTHVTNTGQLGTLAIVDSRRLSPGQTRLTFAVGRRATRAIRVRLNALRAARRDQKRSPR
jgi:alanyl-tRNA synthetase